MPYNLNLARGVYDKMMMTILAHVKPNAKMSAYPYIQYLQYTTFSVLLIIVQLMPTDEFHTGSQSTF